MFGYVTALQRAGVRTVIVCVSRNVRAPTALVHRPTGARIRVLPVPALHRALVTGADRVSGEPRPSAVRRLPRAGLRQLAYCLATPLRATADAIRSEGCAAILCQEYEYTRFDACVLLGRLLCVPVYATYQGASRALSVLERPLRPLAVRGAAGLIAGPSAEAARVARRYRLPREKVARIFNPLDVGEWGAVPQAPARERLGIAPDARVVVWHGRVEIEKKGLDVLLDAWGDLASEDGRRVLLLAGDGRDASKLREMIDAHGSDGVRWIDDYTVDRSELRRRLSAGDVYAFPSRDEGFPVAPVEAMASGLPVVAADASGVPDILEGGERSGGVIVPRGDPRALAAALRRLLEDDGRREELGRRARRRAETAFSPDAVGAQLRRFMLG